MIGRRGCKKLAAPSWQGESGGTFSGRKVISETLPKAQAPKAEKRTVSEWKKNPRGPVSFTTQLAKAKKGAA